MLFHRYAGGAQPDFVFDTQDQKHTWWAISWLRVLSEQQRCRPRSPEALLMQAELAVIDEADILKIDAQRIYVGDNIELGDNRVVVEGYMPVEETTWITEDTYVDGEDSTPANSNYSDSAYLYFDDGVLSIHC